MKREVRVLRRKNWKEKTEKKKRNASENRRWRKSKQRCEKWR